MEPGYIVALVAILVGAGIPLSTLAVRVGLKPLAEAVVKLRESFVEDRDAAALSRRLLELDEEVRDLRQEVARLTETEGFYRELRANGQFEASRQADALSRLPNESPKRD
jgi:hypothetical protein